MQIGSTSLSKAFSLDTATVEHEFTYEILCFSIVFSPFEFPFNVPKDDKLPFTVEKYSTHRLMLCELFSSLDHFKLLFVQTKTILCSILLDYGVLLSLLVWQIELQLLVCRWPQQKMTHKKPHKLVCNPRMNEWPLWRFSSNCDCTRLSNYQAS